MTNYRAFHTRLSSIMDSLTKAAVAEICELVDDSYAVLQLEISRSHKENEALRRKLELIETIIARGQRGKMSETDQDNNALLLCDSISVERSLLSGKVACTKQSNYNLSATVTAVQEPTENSENKELPEENESRPEIVLIKKETSGDLDSCNDTPDILLISEEGNDAMSVKVDDYEEDSSRMSSSALQTRLRDWDQDEDSSLQSEQRSESSLKTPLRSEFTGGRRNPLGLDYMLHEAPSEPGSSSQPGGDNEMESGEPVYDFHSETDADTPATLPEGKRFPYETDCGQNSLAGNFEMKRGVSMVSSLPFNVELDMCSSWSNQGMPGMVSMQHGQYIKPDRRDLLLDKGTDLNPPHFQMTPAGLNTTANQL
ncbi:hypothetical protein UPYG_G00297170 [Umbra pygmaea]|uniref:Uncharacterized protein n=1 Tax=Umbra pygmaea TaxID=75934 RepID=A0ABD0WP93_UMBPY